jgi:hypothetical protein
LAQLKEFESLSATLEKSSEKEQYELPRHLVTVTDISNVDFVGSGGTFIGTNTVRECFQLLIFLNSQQVSVCDVLLFQQLCVAEYMERS